MRDGEKFGYNGMKVEKTKTVFKMPLKLRIQPGVPPGRGSKVWHGQPLVFTSSLTDVFHPDIDPFRHEMWDIINRCPHLTFQLLTKRPERFLLHKPKDWGCGYKNVWMGISAEDQENLNRRMEAFSKIPADVKFLSLEPLLGAIDLSGFFRHHTVQVSGKTESGAWDWGGELTIDYAKQKRLWVIVGGESGNDNGNWKYRKCHLGWIMDIVDQCKAAGVPVFVKQLGTAIAKQCNMKDRHGGTQAEWPAGVTLPREFPSQSENT